MFRVLGAPSRTMWSVMLLVPAVTSLNVDSFVPVFAQQLEFVFSWNFHRLILLYFSLKLYTEISLILTKTQNYDTSIIVYNFYSFHLWRQGTHLIFEKVRGAANSFTWLSSSLYTSKNPLYFKEKELSSRNILIAKLWTLLVITQNNY